MGSAPLELTVLMPCLNEAETIEICVQKAMAWLAESGVSGEVLIADNGSTDRSQELARANGARVVEISEKGYGAALSGGIDAALGTYVIMGDADDSYDFTNLGPFLDELRNGKDLVMGNRFAGGIKPGAMPALHRYLGNPVLSTVGRVLFRAPVRDFHCGLRGFRRQAVLDLHLRTTGMEFASEMVVKASLAKIPMAEVPTTLSPDGRTRAPHLRSFRDGWRHLRFLLIFSPTWLFFYPGLLVFAVGAVGSVALTIGPIGRLDVGALLYASALTIIGYQALWFAVIVKTYAVTEGFLPEGRRSGWVARVLTLERGLMLGFAMIVVGLVIAIVSLVRWSGVDYGALDPNQTVRTVTPAVLGLVLGMQTILGAFSSSVLAIRVAPAEPE